MLDREKSFGALSAGLRLGEIGEVERQSYTATQLELREYFVGRAFNADGTKKRGGQLADPRNATCRKLTDMVFRELCNAGVK